MKQLSIVQRLSFLLLSLCIISSCKEKKAGPSKEIISVLDLKRGKLISCGPADKQFGELDFDISCKGVKEDFNLAVKLLHSFEYDEAEKVFATVIDQNPDCAMAYWGIAMSNFHALWTPPTESELTKGSKAVEIAKSLSGKSQRETAYINAIAAFYTDWNKVDHYSRCIRFEKAMEKLSADYPDDKEASIFYALSLDAAADPADKTFSNQKKAASILNALYPKEPNHPGIIHYLIHTYDYPRLANLGLEAARKYASVAPSSAHALHMPSHIFTRLGLWDECIQSNLVSVSSAECYAEAVGLAGHWDEELHGRDYLVYGYLQKGENLLAKNQLDSLNAMKTVSPVNFKVAYAFAAIPSRYFLENRLWKEAANLEIHGNIVDWKKYPWQESIIHFTRLMGSVNSGDIPGARKELATLNSLHDVLITQKDTYKANQVQIQINTGEAWISLRESKPAEALRLMTMAADMEDKTEKHPVTPCEVLPARELLGDMLMEMKQPLKALVAYETNLIKNPNRFNGLYGAGLACEKTSDLKKASGYYQQLLSLTDKNETNRPELKSIRSFLGDENYRHVSYRK